MNHTLLIGTQLLSECQEKYGAGMVGDGFVGERWAGNRLMLGVHMRGDRGMSGDGWPMEINPTLMSMGIMMGDGIAINGVAASTNSVGEVNSNRMK